MSSYAKKNVDIRRVFVKRLKMFDQWKWYRTLLIPADLVFAPSLAAREVRS